ncbi:hypothetical protein J3F84DRAFT_314917 [Trichoderma pleuroticola]
MATYNDGKPGPMDLSTIEAQRKNVECFNCGKKGHVKKYCRAPRKDGKKFTPVPEPKENRAINTIRPSANHDILHFSACYDDKCQTHLSDKQGSGWFPKGPKKRVQTLNTLGTTEHTPNNADPYNFEEEERVLHEWEQEEAARQDRITQMTWEYRTGYEDLDIAEPCENCGSREPQGPGHPCGWEPYDDPPTMPNSPGQFSYDDSGRICDSSFAETDERHQQWINTLPDTHPFARYKENSPNFEDEEEVIREWEQQEAVRQYDDSLPDTASAASPTPKELLEQWGKIPQIDLTNAYDGIQLPGNKFRQAIEDNTTKYPTKTRGSVLYYVDDILFTDQCNEANIVNCNLLLCKQHTMLKLQEWHEDHGSAECGQDEFTLCNQEHCKKHQHQRHALACVTKKLEQQGFNLAKHGTDEELRGINWNDLRKYHKLTTRHVPQLGCTWCERYNIRNREPGWITSDLDNIDIDPYGNNYYDGADDATYHNLNTLTGGKKLRKFQVPGTLEGHPITVYVDSGATTSYIAPQLVNRLQLDNYKKEKPYTLASIEKQQFTYNNGTVDRETDLLEIRFSEIDDIFSFDIANIAGYDVLLGYDWLESRNPDINWIRGQARWRTRPEPIDFRDTL